jgi:hypothetical protein
MLQLRELGLWFRKTDMYKRSNLIFVSGNCIHGLCGAHATILTIIITTVIIITVTAIITIVGGRK